MIKSDEVKKQLVEMLPRRFSNAPSNIRKFKAHDEVIKYVRQQEKVSKLLELKNKLLYEYDEMFLKALGDRFYLLDSKQYIEDCKRTHKIHNEIKELEGELND